MTTRDEHKEPVVVGATLNSERFVPGKLPIPAPPPQTYEIERDAIRKLREKARVSYCNNVLLLLLMGYFLCDFF